MFNDRCRKPLAPSRGEDGFSLIELMVAILVIGVGLLALASVAITSLRNIRISRERQDAVQIASSVLEEARSNDYGRVALDDGEVSGPLTYNGESVVIDADGQVPHSWTSPDGHRVLTYVTVASSGGKRVTTTVEWDDRGATKAVTKETLLANADRGLPVPNFQLSPEQDAREGVEGETICFDHTLTNLGESDSYSWQLFRYDGSGNLVPAQYVTRSVDEEGTPATREGFKVPASSGPGQGWFAWARMGATAATVSPMTDATADGRPDSASPVLRRDEAVMRICYTPKDTSGNVVSDHDEDASFVVRVYSAFDDTVVREVEDRLTVLTASQRFHLHHIYNNQGDPKPPNQHGYKLVMDTGTPTQTDPSINFDPTSGSNADPHPGLFVPAGTTAIWDWQNVGSVTRSITSDPVNIRLHVASNTSMNGTDDTVNTQVQLVTFNADTGAQTALFPTASLSTAVSAGTFAFVNFSATVTATTVAPDEYLRLRVTCPSSVSVGCHYAYDVAPVYPASVAVTFQ